MEEYKQETTILTTSSQKVWYKTKAGITFLSIVGIFLLTAVIFICIIGFYVWQIKYGDVEQLVKEFSGQKISVDSGLYKDGISQIETVEIKDYIRPHNPVLGEEKPVTIVLFIDFECPYCQEAYGTSQKAFEKYNPLIRLVFKHLPLESLHPSTKLTSNAVACAHEQNKFWNYYDALFMDLDHSYTNLLNLANQIGLNLKTFSTCLDNEKYQGEIYQDFKDAADLGLRGTPSYFINNLKVEGSLTAEDWDNLILQAYNNQ
ncbi:DsbA family protein [Patescibacteria group bacterium]|nr:DsbA family protein [Patescibacteria group bacterium]